jgi:hypothetical protein
MPAGTCLVERALAIVFALVIGVAAARCATELGVERAVARDDHRSRLFAEPPAGTDPQVVRELWAAGVAAELDDVAVDTLTGRDGVAIVAAATGLAPSRFAPQIEHVRAYEQTHPSCMRATRWIWEITGVAPFAIAIILGGLVACTGYMLARRVFPARVSLDAATTCPG